MAARPSLFAYPPPLTVEASKEVAKVEKAVLSTTAKARERARKREQEKRAADGGGDGKEGAAAMETDEGKGGAEASKDGEDAAAAEAAAPPKKPEEPSSYVLTAPARMTLQQVRFVSFLPDSRWVPVKRGAPAVGFVVLRDTTPGEPVDYAASVAVGGAMGGAAAAAAAAAAPAQAAEPPPPAPFEFDG